MIAKVNEMENIQDMLSKRNEELEDEMLSLKGKELSYKEAEEK